MRLYHASPARNVRSIMDRGILTGKSKGRLQVVWLHTACRREWAAMHTVKRHGGRIEDVVVFVADVPRSQLRRFGRGLWYSLVNVYVSQISGYITFGQLAG